MKAQAPGTEDRPSADAGRWEPPRVWGEGRAPAERPVTRVREGSPGLGGDTAPQGQQLSLRAHSVPGAGRAASLPKLTHSEGAMAAALHGRRERAEGTTHTAGGDAPSAVGSSVRAQPSAAHTCRDHTGHPRAWGHVLAGALSRAPKGDGLAGRRLSQLNESPPTWHGGTPYCGTHPPSRA